MEDVIILTNSNAWLMLLLFYLAGALWGLALSKIKLGRKKYAKNKI